MTVRCMFVFFVLSLAVSCALCQTFQYSRGWTNGKRSEFPAEISALGDERFNNGELKRLKMLIHGSPDEQVNFRIIARHLLRNMINFLCKSYADGIRRYRHPLNNKIRINLLIPCSQPLLICDFVDKLRKLAHTDNYAPQLRREKGPNDDNY